MHVERDGRARGFGLGVDAFEIVGAEVLLPHGGGGIAGVARARAIVAGEEFVGDAELLAVEFEGEFGLARVGHVRGSGDGVKRMATEVSSSGCAVSGDEAAAVEAAAATGAD